MVLEAQLNLILNCMVTTVYLYAIASFFTTALVSVVFAAEHVPPTNGFALVFNLWFGGLMLAVLSIMRSLIGGLLFPGILSEPSTSVNLLYGGDGAFSIKIANTKGGSDVNTLAGTLLNVALSHKQDTASPAVPDESNTPSTNVQTVPKSPSSSEHSQADTATKAKQSVPDIVGDAPNTVY